MLDAREHRAETQRRLIGEYRKPLLCFTMNTAGEIKCSPLIELAFYEGVRLIDALPLVRLERIIERANTGPCAYYVFDADAVELKRYAVGIEESRPAHRLFDMDVIDANCEKLSREIPRKCAVCGSDAAVCARSRAHGLDAIKEAQNALYLSLGCDTPSLLAARALTLEVTATPKPGLVDRNNSGAHDDMDIATFYSSIAALLPYFMEFSLSGLSCGAISPALMEELRATGLKAERAMLDATGGVNTHRGAIYSMGLLLGAQGAITGGGLDISVTDGAKTLALFNHDMANAPETHGVAAYRAYGAKGARGEAAAGFPSAKKAAALYADYRTRHSDEDAAALTLPHIMAELDDTNLLHRGGREGLNFVQRRAKEIIALNENERIPELEALDAECIEKRLSPGGAADMLGLGIFLTLISDRGV